MLPVFVGRFCERPTDCALIPVRKRRKEMSARAGAKERRLGTGLMDMAFPLLLPTTPGTAGRSSRKRSGFCQKFEGIGGVGGAAASSMKARSLVVLKPHVKEKSVGKSP